LAHVQTSEDGTVRYVADTAFDKTLSAATKAIPIIGSWADRVMSKELGGFERIEKNTLGDLTNSGIGLSTTIIENFQKASPLAKGLAKFAGFVSNLYSAFDITRSALSTADEVELAVESLRLLDVAKTGYDTDFIKKMAPMVEGVTEGLIQSGSIKIKQGPPPEGYECTMNNVTYDPEYVEILEGWIADE